MPPFEKKYVDQVAPPQMPDLQKVPPGTSITLTLDDLRQLIGGVKVDNQTAGLTAEMLEAILLKTSDIAAKTMQKSVNPSNPHHPGISATSYPEGDHAKPREGILPFRVLWRGFPIEREVQLSAWYELEEMAKLKPGTYTVSKRDGTTMQYIVSAQRSADGEKIEEIKVDYEADRDTRAMVVPPYIAAYQMNHADRPVRETFMEAMSQMLALQLSDQRAKELTPA